MDKMEWDEDLRINYYPWCNDDQWECCEMIFDLVGGDHHLCGKIREWGRGVCYNTRNHSLSTFDFSLLTTMVFMAHDRMIRVEINPSGPGMLKWCLWKRHKREGRMYEYHPTIQTALDTYRKYHHEPKA
jgi:hypothetical protein